MTAALRDRATLPAPAAGAAGGGFAAPEGPCGQAGRDPASGHGNGP